MFILYLLMISYKSNSINVYLKLNTYYNALFVRDFSSVLMTSDLKNDAKVNIPMFFRRVSLFSITCKIVKLSKKKNINSTVWLEGVVSKTRFILVIPRFSKSITIRAIN